MTRLSIMDRTARTARRLATFAGALALTLLAACAARQGYGVTAQAEAQIAMRAADDPKPDTPAMYLSLIRQMQAQRKYYASLAHVDAYDREYGANPESILLRADALRATAQPAAAGDAYRRLLNTPLAAQGHRGLGLLAGEAGDFGTAVTQLRAAVQLAPTDATTLSDLGYALLRDGQLDAARLPLLQALQLDEHDPRVVGNVAVLLSAQGRRADADTLMRAGGLSDAARAAVASDAGKAVEAARARHAAQASAGHAVRPADTVAPVRVSHNQAAADPVAAPTQWGLARLAPRFATTP